MKKKALYLAIGAALVFGASHQVQSDELLFPYFQSGNGTWTFLTLRGDGPMTGNIPGNPFATNTVHYAFNYDDPQLGQCTHFNVFGSMSEFDMIQQTVTAPMFSGLNLPNEFGDSSRANYLLASNTSGFLTVADESFEGAFSGQAIIVNSQAGTVSAYRGINDPLNTPIGFSIGDFDTLGVTTHRSHDMTWYPSNINSTSWFVLVTGIDMGDPDGWNGRIRMSSGFGAVWDRDENPASGNRNVDVTCYRTVTRNDFLTSAQRIHTDGGGWYWAVHDPRLNAAVGTFPVGTSCASAGVAPGTDRCRATGAIMYKIESTTELGGVKTAISEENPFPNLR